MLQTLFCGTAGEAQLVYFIKLSLNIMRFVLPIGLIVMITMDIYKNMVNGYLDNKESIIKKSGNRILACIIVFCIPTIVNIIMSFISKLGYDTNYQDYLANIKLVNNFSEEINLAAINSNTNFATCYIEVNLDVINELKEAEKKQLEAEEEKKRKEALAQAAIYKAEQQALIEANNKKNSTTGEYTSNLTDLNKQNSVYVENGVFYAPKYRQGDETTYSGKQCTGNYESKGYNNPYGYNNYFYTMLQNLIQGAKDAGYNLKISTQGCRTYQDQQKYYANYEPGRAAKPGRSNHGWGIASDVTFYKNANTECGSSRTYSNCPGMQWVHEHAKDYGLHFPLLNASYKEDWHIEPINLKKY